MVTNTHVTPNLRPIETRLVFELFETSPGYILDFTNSRFAEFFAQEVGIDIYDDVYADLGNSKGKRFRTFLNKGRPDAVAKALTALWEYRAAMLRSQGDTDAASNGMEELSAVIQKLGGAPLRGATPARKETSGPDAQTWAALASEFATLRELDPQPRGYAFERFLKKAVEACGLEPREAFRLRGEQIDGSFQLVDTYLLEARWQNAQADAAALRSFQGKVEDRPVWARGLFVSYSGFSTDGMSAFGARRIILMDGLDLHDALERKIPLDKVIAAKARRAAETTNPFVRVRDLF
jgi:hypothetical protein